MKAAQASAFGTPATTLTLSSSVPEPSPPPPDHVQILVHACSLSPSDYRFLSGDASLVKKPRSGRFPYIPGGDVAGVVVAVGPTTTTTTTTEKTCFSAGDRVMATWEAFGEGGLADRVNVHRSLVAPLPPRLDFVHGCAIVDSSANAMLAAEDAQLQATDKLLVLGGSGAVGTALVQIARRRHGVRTIVATSTDTALVSALGADAVVNYREAKWWNAPAVREHAPFDVVIDCAEGVSAWNRVVQRSSSALSAPATTSDGAATAPPLVKSARDGGRFLAVVVNEWHIVIQTVWQMVTWLAPVAGRVVRSWWNANSLPKYRMLFPAQRGDSLQRLVSLIEEGWLQVIIDKDSPLPFTTQGVRQAFDTMIARRGHGKVVIKIRDE